MKDKSFDRVDKINSLIFVYEVIDYFAISLLLFPLCCDSPCSQSDIIDVTSFVC